MHLNNNYINELLFTIKNSKLLVAPLNSGLFNIDLIGSVEL